MGFVDQEMPQLPGTLPVMLGALPFANHHPVADVGQFFQHQRGLRGFGIRHQAFGDGVVDQTTKTPLFAAQLLQAAFRGFRAGTLVGLPSRGAPLAHVLDLLPCIGVAVRIRRDIEGTYGVKQSRMLLRSRDEFELQGQFHTSKCVTKLLRSQEKTVGLDGQRLPLPGLKRRGGATLRF